MYYSGYIAEVEDQVPCNHLDEIYERIGGQMKWRTYEGQGLQQNLQQWSRLMQNGQKFESVLWRMPEWKST